MIWLLLSCAPAPHAIEGALGRAPEPGEIEAIGDRGLAVVLHPDRIEVAGFGWEDHEELGAAPGAATIPLVDGAFLPSQTRGQLVSALYEILLEWAEHWKDRGQFAEEDEFSGDIWLFADRRSRDSTLRKVMFTAGQAQFGNFHLLGTGPRLGGGPPPPKPVVSLAADASRRASPLSPIRIGQLREEDAYLIDDRAARIAVDTVGGATTLATGWDSPLAQLRENKGDPVLYPTYVAAAAAAQYPVLPSVEMLMHVSKHLDDGLMAELQAAREPLKRTWVESALAASADKPEAAAWLQVAKRLGAGEEPPGAAEFLANPLQSKPVGIYGETEALRRVFRRDRWLSQSLEGAPASLRAELAAVLADPRVAPGLQAERVHRAVWTNPAAKPTLEEGGHFVLCPARSFETTWVDSQGGTSRVPNVMEAWVSALQANETEISLLPDSGWYDHQQWALEPLLTHPDAYTVGPGYKERLREAFMTGVALRRETQVKDLMLPAIGSAGSRVIQANVAPSLRVEPVPTHYRRSAEVYTWLLDHALARDEVPAVWSSRTAEIRDLYAGMAAISSVDLGLAEGTPITNEVEADALRLPVFGGGPSLLGGLGSEGQAEPAAPDPTPAPAAVPHGPEVDRASDWLARWQTDPVLGQDVRLMVPMGLQADGDTIGWAILGVRPIDLEVTYEKPPSVVPLDADEVEVHTVSAHYTVLAPFFTEVGVPEPLDRASFRRVADRYPIASELVRALERGERD